MKRPKLVVIGAGGAALSSVIEASEYDIDIILMTKHIYRASNYKWSTNGGCTWKAHGFNAAVGANDSVNAHIRDTLEGGVFANDKKLVEVLCQGSKDLLEWLSTLGVPFERDGKSQFLTRPFGGCDVARSVYNKDMLGFHIHLALHDKVRQLENSKKLEIFENMRAIEIIPESNTIKLKVLNQTTLEQKILECNAIIIADGGGAQMYSPSAASADKTCDGISMVYEAGAAIIDMEFVQFHPTGIVSEVTVFDGSLVEEALRFDGAKLLNTQGQQFMLDYTPLGEMATRDEISRAIFTEMLKTGDVSNASVSLDISSCRSQIENSYPALYKRLLQAGYNINDTPLINVRPTAHYLMGGIKINEEGCSTIPGVFVAGESAGGVHGANRLGGNGLSEALVFGRLAGSNAAKSIVGSNFTEPHTAELIPSFKIKSNNNGKCISSLLHQLKLGMYEHVGPVRSQKSLSIAMKVLGRLENDSKKLAFYTGSQSAQIMQQIFDFKSLLCASKLIVEAAEKRLESRGSHFRTDFEHKNDVYKSFCSEKTKYFGE